MQIELQKFEKREPPQILKKGTERREQLLSEHWSSEDERRAISDEQKASYQNVIRGGFGIFPLLDTDLRHQHSGSVQPFFCVSQSRIDWYQFFSSSRLHLELLQSNYLLFHEQSVQKIVCQFVFLEKGER